MMNFNININIIHGCTIFEEDFVQIFKAMTKLKYLKVELKYISKDTVTANFVIKYWTDYQTIYRKFT